MREKWGSFIQFIAVILAFGMLFVGVVGAYNEYFSTEAGELAATMPTIILLLSIALGGIVIGVGGVVIGNVMKK